MKKVQLVYQHGYKKHYYAYPKIYNFFVKDELADKLTFKENGLLITTAPTADAKKQRVVAYLASNPVPANENDGYKILGKDTEIIKLTNNQKKNLDEYLKENQL